MIREVSLIYFPQINLNLLTSYLWKSEETPIFNIFFCFCFQKCLIHSPNQPTKYTDVILQFYVCVLLKKKFCFCLFGYRSFFPGEQLRFIVRFSFCQNNIHIKDSIVVIKLIIIIHYYILSDNATTAWCDLKRSKNIKILCSWWCTPMIPIYLNYYYLLSLILRNIICNCKQTNKIVNFYSNITSVW